MSLDAVKTIVVLMQENRSFDHLLGYLSLPPWNRSDIDGLSTDPAWLSRFANPVPGGAAAGPSRLPDPGARLPGDPPHDRKAIAAQLGAPVGGAFPMTGFAGSFPTPVPATGQPMVMGYFQAGDVPTTHFFAENFVVCDRWFSSLPASTQPNRLMVMAGESLIDDNREVLPSQRLVYDWLEDNRVRWRVYHDGLPFFAMMPEWIPWILLDNNFRDFSRFFHDIQNESDDTFPQVIFLEPRFTDAPHIEAPNDDHAPSPIRPGQEFQAQVYAALTSNQDRWAGTVLLVTYDEHGGFFDHVSPPALATLPPAGASYPPFATLGARVPGLVVSPLVRPGAAYHGLLDHTSILKFLADKFTPGKPYSAAVDGRAVKSVSEVLQTLGRPPGSAPSSAPVPGSVQVGFSPGTAPAAADANLTPLGFSKALTNLRSYDKDVAALKFPKLAGRF